MDKINIDDIVIKGNRIYVNKEIKHPYIYKNGCIDLSPLHSEKLKELSKKSEKEIISEVFEYLQKPEEYKELCIPIFPEYL